MKRDTIERLSEIEPKFYRLPKVLFTSDRYVEMSSLSKALYMILLDRRCLSEWSGDAWKDEYGCTFIYFTIEDMMGLLHLGNKKINGLLKELERYGLIFRRHQGLGKPNKLYVYDLLSENNSKWVSRAFLSEGGVAVNE